MRIKRISVVGLGYVGLPTAVCLAKAGFNVHGFDVDGKKLDQVAGGILPFHEPKLGLLLSEVLGRNLTVGDELVDSDLYMITVGTPPKSDGSIDLRQVKNASRMVGARLKQLRGFRVVVIKSTVTPGTTAGVVKSTIESASGKQVPKDVGLAANPEFLREGFAVDDTLRPERVVIGGMDRRSGDVVEGMYRSLHASTETQYIRTTPVNAELTKCASNAFLATKVSFINTIADMAARLPGADVMVVAAGLGMDRRIGPHFLKAGLGYGGSCLPKDMRALVSTARSLKTDATLFEAVERVNKRRVKEAVRLAKKHLGSLKNRRMALLGLSFKPGTDDVRDAVSLRLIDALLAAKAKVVAYDPVAVENVRRLRGRRIDYAKSIAEAIDGADCCFIVTEWEEFRKLSAEDFKAMRTKVIIDGRRALNPAKFAANSSFEGIGLGS